MNCAQIKDERFFLDMPVGIKVEVLMCIQGPSPFIFSLDGSEVRAGIIVSNGGAIWEIKLCATPMIIIGPTIGEI